MHPGFFGHWKRHRAAHCGEHVGHGHGEWSAGPEHGAGFGVRRPLRFMAHKLDLDGPQIEKIAQILGALKTERAQASVDQRRRLTALADALKGETFDAAKFAAATEAHLESEKRVQAAVQDALVGVHAVLRPEQRERLAYLMVTGALTI